MQIHQKNNLVSKLELTTGLNKICPDLKKYVRIKVVNIYVI
jgi:hypothetical protein